MLQHSLPKNLPKEIDPDRITAFVRIGASSRSFMGETILAVHAGTLTVLMRDSSFGPFVCIQPSRTPEYEDFGLDHVLWITDERGLRLEVQVSAGEMEEVREFLAAWERAEAPPPARPSSKPAGAPPEKALLSKTDTAEATGEVGASPGLKSDAQLFEDIPTETGADSSDFTTESGTRSSEPPTEPEVELGADKGDLPTEPEVELGADKGDLPTEPEVELGADKGDLPTDAYGDRSVPPTERQADTQADESDIPTETGEEIPLPEESQGQDGETREGGSVASHAIDADTQTSGEDASDWRKSTVFSTQQHYVDLGEHKPAMKMLLDEERWQDISVLLENCAELAPAERECLADLDRCAQKMAEGDLEGAFYWLTDEISSYSSEFTDLFLVRLSEIATQAGDLPMAAEFLLESITPELKTRADELLHRLHASEEDLKENRTEAACRYYRQRTVDNPDDAQAWSRAAAWHYMSIDADEALPMARKALALDPTRADAGSVLFEALTDQGEIDEAQEELERFAQAHPDLAWPWSELSRLHEDHRQDADNALRNAREALKRSPWDTDLQQRVEELLVLAARWEELADHLTVVSQYQRDLWEQARVLERLADVWKDRLDEKQRAKNVLQESKRLNDLYFAEPDDHNEEDSVTLQQLLARAPEDTLPPAEETEEKTPQPFLTGCLVVALLGCLAIIVALLLR